jgi:hypothetical protein
MTDSQAALSLEQLEDADWSVRKRAVLALGKLDAPAVVPALIRSLQDEFMSVRAVAAIELGKRGDAAAVPGLIATAQDGEWIVRKNVVMALIKIGDPDIVPALIDRLQDAYYVIRALAAVELAKRGELVAIPSLIEMLRYQHADLNATASAALTAMGAPAVGALLQFLPQRPIERKVGTVLWNMGDAKMLPRKILGDPRLSVRDRITVLEKLRRARNPWGSTTFLYRFPETRALCLTMLQEEDIEARAGAQKVLAWLDGDRHLVQASQRDQDRDLLRSAPGGDAEPLPATLLRGANAPDTPTEQPSPRRSPWQKLFGKRKNNTKD